MKYVSILFLILFAPHSFAGNNQPKEKGDQVPGSVQPSKKSKKNKEDLSPLQALARQERSNSLSVDSYKKKKPTVTQRASQLFRSKSSLH